MNYEIAHFEDISGVACPCGTSRRAFADSGSPASVHLVDISIDAQTHYHKHLTETYVILEGEGQMELDGKLIPIRPGHTIRINPGCRHRALGQLKIMVIAVPAFDPTDEWFD
jgi:mannose-6-phosphate isomerase-like protein (cupin superfamily)